MFRGAGGGLGCNFFVVVLASEPVGRRSRATELPKCLSWYMFYYLPARQRLRSVTDISSIVISNIVCICFLSPRPYPLQFRNDVYLRYFCSICGDGLGPDVDETDGTINTTCDLINTGLPNNNIR